MNTLGLLVVVGVLVVATAIGLALRARAGRVRLTTPGGPGPAPGWAIAAHDPGADDRVLLLQVSSPVCTPCRQTAGLLGDLAAATPGLVHVEVDVADRPEVAAELGVMRTPTVVAFDVAGTELLRVSGVPRRLELERALAPALAP